MTPELALQAAIVALLRATPAVTALTADRIFDEVPADRPDLVDAESGAEPAPYVFCAAIETRELPEGRNAVAWCYLAWTARVRLIAAAPGFGRGTAWALAHAVRAALRIPEPLVGGGYRLQGPITVERCADAVDPLGVKVVAIDCAATIFDPNPGPNRAGPPTSL